MVEENSTFRLKKGFKQYSPVLRQGPNKLMFQSGTALTSNFSQIQANYT